MTQYPQPSGSAIHVLGVAGSLRRDSFNHRLLAAAAARTPPTLVLDLYDDLGSVPLFNEDLEEEHSGGPEGVVRLRQAVARADGLLIATPEYNQSMPGVVKNMIDWLSRSEPEVLAGKPVAIMGATVGPWGTRLAQAALRQTLTACGALIMPVPQIYLRSAAGAFDSDGRLIDEHTGTQLTGFLGALQQWVEPFATKAVEADGRQAAAIHQPPSTAPSWRSSRSAAGM